MMVLGGSWWTTSGKMVFCPSCGGFLFSLGMFLGVGYGFSYWILGVGIRHGFGLDECNMRWLHLLLTH